MGVFNMYYLRAQAHCVHDFLVIVGGGLDPLLSADILVMLLSNWCLKSYHVLALFSFEVASGLLWTFVQVAVVAL
jgi:hypothetical protein